MFEKIGDILGLRPTKGDTLSAHPATSARKVGADDDARGQNRDEKQDRKAPPAEDDFAPDRTVFSLAAIRAGLMEGAGSLTEAELAEAAGLFDLLTRHGIRGVPVSEGQGLIAALREAARML